MSTNPRVDGIYLTVRDSTEAGGVSDDFTIQIVAGTETAGATLDNRTNAGSAPASSILLADVLVQTGPTITIRDRRPIANPGVLPAHSLVGYDGVMFQSPYLAISDASTPLYNSTNTTQQVAALFYLPSKITATKIRWKYVQHATTANTSSYNIGIYDASGRQIVTTGAVSATGATNSVQERSETISSTTFYPGMYYVVTGGTNATGGTYVISQGVWVAQSGRSPLSTRGVLLANSSGGTTLPTTLLSFTDVGASTSSFANYPSVPLIGLSTS